MKVIDRIKTNVLRIWRSQALKYAVVFIVGVLIVGFLDENSVWSHMKNRQRIDELTEEKARYHADYQRDQAKIRELDRNPKAMEKIARERYFMKTDDEDIFVLRENEDLSSDQTDSNEKAE
jgi:cell division protein FtsB